MGAVFACVKAHERIIELGYIYNSFAVLAIQCHLK